MSYLDPSFLKSKNIPQNCKRTDLSATNLTIQRGFSKAIFVFFGSRVYIIYTFGNHPHDTISCWLYAHVCPYTLAVPLPGGVLRSNSATLLKVKSRLFVVFVCKHVYPLVNIQKTMENHNVSWENPLFLWPFSIAILVYQRVHMRCKSVNPRIVLWYPYFWWFNHQSPWSLRWDDPQLSGILYPPR